MSGGIRRRRFLTGLTTLAAAGGSARWLTQRAYAAEKRTEVLKVTAVEMLQLTGHNQRKSLYLRIRTDQGCEGLYGPIDEDAAVFVDRYFRPRLVGQDALAGEAFWDRMFRSHRHARGSHYLMGLSAIDNALWDLRGRYLNLPVYRLLGGSRRKLRAYASCLGLSQETSAMQAKARELKQEGFRHQKWFLRSRGPHQGPAGVEEDVRVVRELREAVGEDVDLMFDAFSTWDINYARDWARRAERYRPRWIEEPFPTAQIDAFVELARQTSIPVATGEHFYNRWDVHNFLKRDAISVVQADPEWCGGVSELVKMCTLASVHGAHVIPHGHSMHAAMHVVAGQPLEVCPLVEFLLNKMLGTYYYFDKDPPRPTGGEIELPDRPGFGIELDPAKIADQRVVKWERTGG